MKIRPDDEAGIAFILNGLSSDHRDYLAAGGYGFMIGDGRLSYGRRKSGELYYQAALRSTSGSRRTINSSHTLPTTATADQSTMWGCRFHAEF